MKRREFLAAGVAAAALAMTNVEVKAEVTDSTYDGKSADKQQSARLCLGSQLGIIPGGSMEEKLAKMKAWGMEAVELGGNVANLDEAKKIKQQIADAGLIPSAVCWGSHNGDLMSFDKERKQKGTDDLKKVLEGAGIVGCTGVIYVPAFNGQSPLTNQEMRKMLLDDFPALADFAAECGTTIIFEPLNRGEAYFLRQVADGAAIARDINELSSKKCGMTVMGDFYHMSIEETDMMGAFISGGKLLSHVHLAGGVSDPRRTIPGQNKSRFVEGFRGLKYIGYTGPCSFECGVRGDREVEIPKALAFLKKEYELAVI
ncbi:MAG: sugar phosphate isomerase/epimerase family protein [Planctomycetia bacterium]|nr:sugar phosphate isomerase/epimerase family protein [Planctomycetia bacterium]